MSTLGIPGALEITPVDLSERTDLGVTGHTVAVILPNGKVIDLWIYHTDIAPGTTSVDVRYRGSIDYVNDPNSGLPIDHVILLPGHGDTKTVAAVVLENR